jgi:hypothetical protein
MFADLERIAGGFSHALQPIHADGDFAPATACWPRSPIPEA